MRQMTRALEFLKRVKGAGKCLSYTHGNESGTLWEMLWKFEDGKLLGKVCASGLFVDWSEYTDEQALRRISDDFALIRGTSG